MTFEERQRLAKVAAAEAAKIRRQAGIGLTSPVDPVDLAVEVGCEVVFKSLPTLEGIYSPSPHPTIFVGSERPAGRRAFNCAHELGHHALNHGFRIDEFEAQKKACRKIPEEYAADVFAGFLLMPQVMVRKAMNDRGLSDESLSVEELYSLASFFGVGYDSLITHFTWSLKILNKEQAHELRKVRPRMIKGQHGVDTQSELIIVDTNWHSRAVNLEIGDVVALPAGVEIDPDGRIETIKKTDEHLYCRAVLAGITRAFDETNAWGVNIRVCNKFYAGFAEYRFLEEPEDEDE